MLGSLPSNLVDFFDFNRFAELLCDGNTSPVTTSAELDALPRAVTLVRTAEGMVAMACRTKNTYSLQQLRDLVRDYQLPAGTISGTGADAHEVGISGHQIIELIANLAWCKANSRKRYTKDSPQGQDPACEYAEDRLNLLKAGERIFVMDGVMQYDGTTWTGTWYGGEISEAGTMSSGNLNDAGLCAPRLWGCKIGRYGPSSRVIQNGGGNSCCD